MNTTRERRLGVAGFRAGWVFHVYPRHMLERLVGNHAADVCRMDCIQTLYVYRHRAELNQLLRRHFASRVLVGIAHPSPASSLLQAHFALLLGICLEVLSTLYAASASKSVTL